MRMERNRVINVPSIVCVRVCLPKTILDQAIKGVKRKSKRRYGESTRKITVTKSNVEYVIWPDIFQSNVINDITVDTRKMFNDIVERISFPNVLTKRYVKPKSIESVKKYTGLSFLFENS